MPHDANTDAEQIRLATGKDFGEWVSLIKASSQTRLSDIIKFLQEKHGLEYRVAHTLTHQYLAHEEKNAATVSYTSSGRGGKVIYRSPGIHFECEWEFGGGNCLAIIFIPTPEHWERETGTPLAERQSILEFMGDRILKDQTTGNAHYEIDDQFLTIMY